MRITVNIEASSPEKLQEAIAGLAGITSAADSVVAEAKKETKAATKKAESKKETKKAEPDKKSDPEKEETKAEDVPSVADVRKKAQAVGEDPANKPKVKELLKEFGVPNVSSVPEDRRAEFIQRLEEL